MTSATIDASTDTSGTGDHSPVLRSDEEGTMHTLTEATCGTSPDVAAVTLEFTGVTIVDNAAQDDKPTSDGLATVHVVTQETQLDVGILEQAADDQQNCATLAVGDSTFDDLSIEDLLRQAGWESRGSTGRGPNVTLVGEGATRVTQPPAEAKDKGKAPSKPKSTVKASADKGRATGPPQADGKHKNYTSVQDNKKQPSKNPKSQSDGA